jgi:uncharacterized protein (DUF983 family)
MILDGERLTPEAVSWDERRRFPFMVVMFIGIVIVVMAAFIGAAMVSLDLVWAAIILVLPVTVIALLVLSRLLGGTRRMIVVKGKIKEYALAGKIKDLRDLHYQTSKMSISLMKSDEKERVDTPRAGSFKGDDILGSDENRAFRKDLKKLVGKRRSVKTTICPECGSTDMYYEAGLITGYVYHCKRCDYTGSFVVEKELHV